MTIAEQVLRAWNARKTTYPLRSLAISIDGWVKIEETKAPFGFNYAFSDGSFLRSRGKGKSFRLYLATA